ncbi:MAG TPA: AgmX/PglI C-terminal domain-containing protein, partial [Labilithrix sp.]|nr:AgmX/PglI C-terminal domain-containing protein [Labilithrix sp.]
AQALGAISGESVDESQRARILASAIEGGRLAPVAYGLQAVLGAATFGLALVPALGNGRHPATASAALAVVLGAALLAGALAIAQGRSSAPRALLAARDDASLEGVALPVLVEAFSHRGASAGSSAPLVLRKDGAGAGTVETSSCGPGWSVYADGAATLAMLRARIGPPRSRPCTRKLVFVARREHPRDLDAHLGYLAGYLGTRAYLPMSMDGIDDEGPRSTTLRVVSVADDAIEIDGVRIRLPLAADAAPARTFGESKTRIVYVFRPTDTVERIVQTTAAVETAYRAHLATWELERFLDDGARPPPPPPPPPSAGPGLRAGALTVSGRLPPEVIQRIVRQSFGRFRLCYENGLRTNPALRGRVSVKFVIDRSGAVSAAADGGSDLPDRAVVACLVRSFGNLSFPQPEGGIVTVIYPLVFEPSP